MKNPAAILINYLSQPSATVLAMTDYSSHSRLSTPITAQNEFGYQFKKFKRFFKKLRYLPFIIVGVIVLVLIMAIVRAVVGHNAMAQQTPATAAANTPVSISKPLAVDALNKTFAFPLNNAAGQQVSQIQYVIQSAELDNQIVVQGQVATAVQGRVFLVLNLKITNSYDKSVQLNTRDYIRLVVDKSTDRLAADIHNDPVDIEPISTKYTRLGFPIDSNFKNLTLQVGQITGTKQLIQLNFK